MADSGERAALFAVRGRAQQRQVERYWLCSDCAAQWTLIYDRECGVALAPLRRPPVSVTISAAGMMRGAA